jgi:hypothetical protein
MNDTSNSSAVQADKERSAQIRFIERLHGMDKDHRHHLLRIEQDDEIKRLFNVALDEQHFEMAVALRDHALTRGIVLGTPKENTPSTPSADSLEQETVRVADNYIRIANKATASAERADVARTAAEAATRELCGVDFRSAKRALSIIQRHVGPVIEEKDRQLIQLRDLLVKADEALKHHGGMHYTNTWLARDITAATTK